MTSDHPLRHAFRQNAFCDQHVKYRKSGDAIRFSYEIIRSVFRGAVAERRIFKSRKTGPPQPRRWRDLRLPEPFAPRIGRLIVQQIRSCDAFLGGQTAMRWHISEGSPPVKQRPAIQARRMILAPGGVPSPSDFARNVQPGCGSTSASALADVRCGARRCGMQQWSNGHHDHKARGWVRQRPLG